MPIRYYRKNSQYFVIIESELEKYPTLDDQKNARLFNQLIENHVKNNIEQYLWAHRRFKTRPDGGDVYPIWKSREKRRQNERKGS